MTLISADIRDKCVEQLDREAEKEKRSRSKQIEYILEERYGIEEDSE